LLELEFIGWLPVDRFNDIPRRQPGFRRRRIGQDTADSRRAKLRPLGSHAHAAHVVFKGVVKIRVRLQKHPPPPVVE
jgi:hypothetical protein